MTMLETTQKMEEPLRIVRQCYERVHLMVSDLDDDYFDSGINPDDQGDWWKLAYGFNKASTRSDIILDSMARMRDALAEIEAIMKQIESETPPPMIDPATGSINRTEAQTMKTLRKEEAKSA